ncbi:MAG: hypothetical protein IPO39_13355 [Bacteroidetes bacterium]|nr:hypothetical protein [Bacteroidota bacterium]
MRQSWRQCQLKTFGILMSFNTDKRNSIKHPTEDFKQFLYEYFDETMIGGRREEDSSILMRLTGQEKEAAEQLILDNLGTKAEWLIRAAGNMKIKSAIPILQNIFNTTTDLHTRMYIAKTLNDWIGFPDFVKILDHTMDNGNDFSKHDIVYYAIKLEKQDALRLIFKGLQDKDSFVRWLAFDALTHYRKIPEQTFEQKKYYTGEEVYQDKTIFEQRLKTLRQEVEQEIK